MVSLTTGLIDNPSVSTTTASMICLRDLLALQRPSTNVTVLISNDDIITVTVQISGFYVSGSTKIQYVAEEITLSPGGVATRNYFAQFDAFEFQFITNSCAT